MSEDSYGECGNRLLPAEKPVCDHLRMTTPRSLLVDPDNECDYHVASRCVRRAFLCGVDPLTGRDCSHRRGWLLQRLKQLTPCFAVDVYSYTVLSNHFHLALRHDPVACRFWTDEEVAWRWFDAFPPKEHGEVVEELKPERRELMLGDPNRVAAARRTLGSLSGFMKHLKQPIARRANLEDDCEGHFFEQRFYSGALLTEEAMIAAMAYIDLNPVRAELADRIEAITDTSIAERLQVNSAEALDEYLRPVLSGLDDYVVGGSTTWSSPEVPDGTEHCIDEYADTHIASASEEDEAGALQPQPATGDAEMPPTGSIQGVAAPDCGNGNRSRRKRSPPPAIRLVDYIDILRGMVDAEQISTVVPPNRVAEWLARTKVLKRRQRAYGNEAALRNWTADRGLRLREVALPV